MPGAASPVGSVTRGTTNTNRLRRVDRWIATLDSLRTAADPLVVDLGYGASGITALEMHRRLRDARPDVRVVGIEIEPGRVARARATRPGSISMPTTRTSGRVARSRRCISRAVIPLAP